ncbi:LysR family transcriptional regulator [Paenibacillus sp. MMS20-IR301]|uniref:LysR family transcriptional regulator n=1 Tax=Paenibacillus sp. MMS20-IR301 TaxID=2895946 RepID=UPI0028E4525B|nr:LysR family transcriptional regulator [Paenibacillus sp. MMS20-IR301]WNS47054.1 LysR family transcriptional regulator [Paenibacillus sp. MMS20-IR301]
MNNTQIRLFVLIAESRSFTKAGLELNMTQPAVSRAISALEAELDVKLLLRDRRSGLKLTGIGERLLVICRGILGGFNKIEQEIAAEKGLEKGQLRIGAFPVAAAHFIPSIIRAISAKYPGVELSLHEGSVAEVKEWLDTRFIDVGLVIPPVEEFAALPLFREKLYAVLPGNHPLAQKPSITVQELETEPMLLCRSGYEPPVVDLFRRAGCRLNVKYEVNSYITALNMINEGLAAGVMSQLSLLSLPPNVAVRELAEEAYRDIHVVVPSLEEASIAVRLFIDTALQLFSGGAAAEPIHTANIHKE